jgi:hypothetical protein
MLAGKYFHIFLIFMSKEHHSGHGLIHNYETNKKLLFCRNISDKEKKIDDF